MAFRIYTFWCEHIYRLAEKSLDYSLHSATGKSSIVGFNLGASQPETVFWEGRQILLTPIIHSCFPFCLRRQWSRYGLCTQNNALVTDVIEKIEWVSVFYCQLQEKHLINGRGSVCFRFVHILQATSLLITHWHNQLLIFFNYILPFKTI